MKNNKWFALALFGLWAVGPVIADDIRIGYVNADKILLEAPQGQQALEKLKAEFEPRDNELKKMAESLSEIENTYNANILSLSGADQRRQEKAIIRLRRRLNQTQQDVREQYNWRRNEELTMLQKIVANAINDVAQADGFHLIIDDTVYVNPRLDITEKVLDKLKGQLRENVPASVK